MFKRLFSSNEIEKAFIDSKINNKHDMMSSRKVVDLANQYFQPTKKQGNPNFNINISINNNINNQININITPPSHKAEKNKSNSLKRDQLTQYILKKLRDGKLILRIKTLVLCHAIIRKTSDELFMKIIEDELDHYIIQGHQLEEKQANNTLANEHFDKANPKNQNIQSEFIQKKIVSVYSLYIKKLILNMKTLQYANQFSPFFNKQETDIIQVINKGFIVLNLINYILRSQSTFNKMGRYYPESEEMLNVFIMYINDLIIYNKFVKNIANITLKEFGSCGPQTMKHHYLFITEAQKSSDRLYQFFYNRYYYRRVRQIVTIPTFLDIHNQEFIVLAEHIKKHDKQLFLLVDNSKFSKEEKSRERCKTNVTFINQQKQRINRTDAYERTKKGFEQISMYIKDVELQKTFEDFQNTFQVKVLKIAKKMDK